MRGIYGVGYGEFSGIRCSDDHIMFILFIATVKNLTDWHKHVLVCFGRFKNAYKQACYQICLVSTC